ncbi:LytR/AlgR family response regulator transcription factor [Bifidobacterium phasiani]|uniref:Response regulator transcription factor n=1 Tax=Bifidobacterium phasiani TaxID=2834431 RepID=A0ABS6W6T1_9BIFI|nr:LytTR family DNA-binding domain-containing protein [Bifidobacterium phasiani]MBW3082185.1 response regulator transcription factor [Bifidobacterium phasiani]
MMNIAVVDDDDRDAAVTIELIDRYYAGDETRYAVTRYGDGGTFLEGYRADFDLVVLDVEMPGLDGLETARRLREIDGNVVLVFTTKMAQYAAAGYDVDAIGYLLKPLEYFNLALKMRKAEELVRSRRGVTIPLSVDGGMRFLSSHDVRYVEVFRHDLVYHTGDGPWRVRGSLKEAARLLEPADFVACSRFCLVNLEWVRAVTDNDVRVDTFTLPVSRSKKKALMQALARYYGR